MILLSLLNLSVRDVAPAWVEARSLSAYLLVFQGGTALGSLIWGVVATRIGLQATLICAGSGLLLNLALASGIRSAEPSSRSPDFTAAMYRLESSRRRNGALYWGLFADPLRPGFCLEEFLVESWLEHFSQHERVTVDDDNLQEVIRAMQVGQELPRVQHYVAHERTR
jgi:hypothetical protein